MRIILSILAGLSALASKAQTPFFSTVQVEYEKTVSVHQLMRAVEPEWFESSKEHMPVETKSYFMFTGDTMQSVYRQTKEAVIPPGMWFSPVADNNVVYNNYRTGRTITQKPVFETTFLVDDSLLKIKWKITGDTRNIAGYECRKAVGIVFDSVAVFAFYTDELMVPGGPEGIQGLPGMILGVGIPRLHTTWFATRVTPNAPMNKVAPEKKGKSINRRDMIDAINKVMKDWGGYGKNLVMNYLI